MDKHDVKRFAAALGAACAIYDRKPLPDAAMELYWGALEGFPIEDVEAAMQRHISQSPFFPKPADLIGLMAVSSEEQGLIAWGQVYDAVRFVGSYGVPTFEDENIWPAIRAIGGWKHLCSMQEAHSHFWQKRFMDAYGVVSKSPPTALPRAALKVLMGGKPDGE